MLINNQGLSIKADTNKILKFISYFRDLHCESFKNSSTHIDKSLKLYEIIINHNDTLDIYQMIESEIKPKEYNFNVSRMYGVLNKLDIMLIQDHVFNKVLINIDELRN